MKSSMQWYKTIASAWIADHGAYHLCVTPIGNRYLWRIDWNDDVNVACGHADDIDGAQLTAQRAMIEHMQEYERRESEGGPCA